MTNTIKILFLSDIHLGTRNDASIYRSQLESDLRCCLNVGKLDYLVISGDIARDASEEDYEAASIFVKELLEGFALSSERVIIAPGNHDLNWAASRAAYEFIYMCDLENGKIPIDEKEKYVPAGEIGVLRCNEKKYENRFSNFNDKFYKKIYLGIQYPTDCANQGIISEHPEHCLLFLSLNSCWEMDHYYKNRMSINMILA